MLFKILGDLETTEVEYIACTFKIASCACLNKIVIDKWHRQLIPGLKYSDKI